MKNETARREIESLDYYLQNHTDDYSEESHTAMMMGIKALEQEPCEDAISRQAVQDYIAKYLSQYLYNDVREAVEVIDEYIGELPPVNPTKTGWIPVSERLPEDKTYVLTTIKVPNRIARARSGWYEGGFFHNDNGDVWKATDMEVVAWMPLPKPYEPQESEE